MCAAGATGPWEGTHVFMNCIQRVVGMVHHTMSSTAGALHLFVTIAWRSRICRDIHRFRGAP